LTGSKNGALISPSIVLVPLVRRHDSTATLRYWRQDW
jgi:hypothetical protein